MCMQIHRHIMEGEGPKNTENFMFTNFILSALTNVTDVSSLTLFPDNFF